MIVLQFVGSGDAFGSGGRFQACISIRSDDGHVLLDCGASSLVALKRLGLDPRTVDAVIVSHLHGDHFGGIPFLILDQQFASRTRPLVLAGPVGFRQRLTHSMEALFPGSSAVERRFDVALAELAPDTRTHVASIVVEAVEVAHPSGAPALGLRLSVGGRLIAYSGDTAWTDSLRQIAADADVFICEAYTYDRAIKHHLSYASLRDHQSELACQRIVLTHVGPDMLAHQSDVHLEIASDGLQIHL